MTRWEHKRIVLDREPEAKMNALGSEGWELVAIEGATAGTVALATFKREIAPALDPDVDREEATKEVQEAMDLLMTDSDAETKAFMAKAEAVRREVAENPKIEDF